MAVIGFMLFIEIISHFGMLMYMGIMQKRGKLTEQFFALSQVGYFNLYVLTGFLLTPLTLNITITFVVITIILWILGYPFARWIYRQLFANR
jgi:hypothetical protein